MKSDRRHVEVYMCSCLVRSCSECFVLKFHLSLIVCRLLNSFVNFRLVCMIWIEYLWSKNTKIVAYLAFLLCILLCTLRTWYAISAHCTFPFANAAGFFRTLCKFVECFNQALQKRFESRLANKIWSKWRRTSWFRFHFAMVLGAVEDHSKVSPVSPMRPNKNHITQQTMQSFVVPFISVQND